MFSALRLYRCILGLKNPRRRRMRFSQNMNSIGNFDMAFYNVFFTCVLLKNFMLIHPFLITKRLCRENSAIWSQRFTLEATHVFGNTAVHQILKTWFYSIKSVRVGATAFESSTRFSTPFRRRKCLSWW